MDKDLHDLAKTIVTLQNEAVELKNEGYPHFVGSSLVRTCEDEVLIEEDLTQFIVRAVADSAHY